MLTNSNYAFLQSIRSIGYLIGGVLHYFVVIPDKRRYPIAVVVYFSFVLLDGLLLSVPYYIMCIFVFILGVLGSNSANIRVSAVAAQVPNQYRAKLNAIFSILISAATILGQLSAGFLAEKFSYQTVRIAFQVVYLFGILVFIIPKKHQVKQLYNYETQI